MGEHKLFKYAKNKQWSEFLKELNDTCDLNVQDENLNYIIQYIILENNISVLKEFLKYDIVIDWIDTEGKTILYVPIKYGFIDIVKLLIEYDKKHPGVNLFNSKDSSGNLPIHYAIKFKNLKMFELLLPYGKQTIIDNLNNTLFQLAIKTKNIDFIKALDEKYININNVNNMFETALHIAVSYNLIDIVTIISKINNVNPNIRESSSGFTPLMIAMLNDNKQIISILLQLPNIDINIQDHNGNTAIHLAVIENNTSLLIDLFKQPFIYNNINLDGNTCLHIVLSSDVQYEREILETLIENTTLNIQNNEGNTIWHYLIKTKLFVQFTKLLSTKNNNIFIKNRDNVTPYDLYTKLSPDNKEIFESIICDSYYNKLTKDPNVEWTEEWENKCKTSNESKKKCVDKIKTTIFTDKKSLPIDKHDYYNVIDIDEPNFVAFTTFTGISLDIITSYITLGKKYSNTLFLSITDQFHNNNAVKTYYTKLGISKNLDIEHLNFEIFWIYQQLIFPTHIINMINDFIKSDKIIMAIPIAIDLNIGAHANVLIIDKRFNTIERFEPNGKNEPINFNYNKELLDDLLTRYFITHFKSYKYLSPSVTQQNIGFQSTEIYETDKHKKIGDPGGFCVVWCIWYLEQRLKYNINPEHLALKLLIKIKSKNISFKKLIRMYSSNILQTRNDILTQLELDINDVRNENITEIQKNNLIQLIKLELTQI